MLPTKFRSFGQVVSEEKIFRNRPIRNKNWLWQPCLYMDREEMSNLYRWPPIDDTDTYQVSVHLAKRFQRRRLFRNQPIRNKNCLWWPCLLTDREEKNFKNLPSRNKSRLWRPCLLTNRDEMSKLYRGPSISIDASYQVSVHLAEGFQRRRVKS